MVNHGVDINAKDNTGRTALMYVLSLRSECYEPMVKCLLSNGADTNIVNNNNVNALILALTLPVNENIVNALIEAGADVKKSFALVEENPNYSHAKTRLRRLAGQQNSTTSRNQVDKRKTNSMFTCWCTKLRKYRDDYSTISTKSQQ